VTRDLGTAIRGVLVRAEPVLVFLAGPNGAGKSTFFRDYLQELNLPFINADEMARRLRESSRPPDAEDVWNPFGLLRFIPRDRSRSELIRFRIGRLDCLSSK